jgi:hypothetical protein
MLSPIHQFDVVSGASYVPISRRIPPLKAGTEFATDISRMLDVEPGKMRFRI